jgi:hypothetical protein
MISRAFMIWLLIAVAEVIHGILRVRFLNRRVGDQRARQIGVFSGSANPFDDPRQSTARSAQALPVCAQPIPGLSS